MTILSYPERIPETPTELRSTGSRRGAMTKALSREKQTTNKARRPMAQVGDITGQPIASGSEPTGRQPIGSALGEKPNTGRKSGRLREKGPTTYTSKGEIIRGGKRVNEEIHDQGMTKRARHAIE